jgi:nicotinamidase
MTKTALLLIDIQYDFIPPNGSLAVNGGDQILAPVYRILDEAADHFDLIVASLVCLPSLRVARCKPSRV